MKVYMNRPKNNWVSPYTILEKIYFWREIGYDEPVIRNLAKGLTPFSKALQKVLNVINPEITYVKIDSWDAWNVDSTLAILILPMLKELKKSKHGSGYIDLEDVPEHLRYTENNEFHPQKSFDFYNEGEKLDIDVHTRYNWFLDELIWTFEQLNTDWEEQYYSGNIDHIIIPCDFDANGKPMLYTFEDGPNHTFKVDWQARQSHQKRIDNGLRLFGKYFQTLWD